MKVVGEPYEGKPHVRFEVAGDGNQDMVWVFEALSKETESKQAAPPKSQAPSLDPTSRQRLSALVVSRLFGFAGRLVQNDGSANPAPRLSFSVGPQGKDKNWG